MGFDYSKATGSMPSFKNMFVTKYYYNNSCKTPNHIYGEQVNLCSGSHLYKFFKKDNMVRDFSFDRNTCEGEGHLNVEYELDECIKDGKYCTTISNSQVARPWMEWQGT